MNEDFLDDRVIIPEDIQNMSLDELHAAIEELKQEIAAGRC